MQATLQGSRYWIQIGEIEYQRQYNAARKKLEALGAIVVKGWMDRDDEDEIAEAVFVVDVVGDQVPTFVRQASRLGWTNRMIETVVIQRQLTDAEREADLAAFGGEIETAVAQFDTDVARFVAGAA